MSCGASSRRGWPCWPASTASFPWATCSDSLAFGSSWPSSAALALGAGFYQLAQQPASLFKQWQQRLAAAAGLRWILAGLGWLLQWIELGWRNALLVVEGEGYLGWVVLVLLLAVLAVQL
jgi:hypothetical protein